MFCGDGVVGQLWQGEYYHLSRSPWRYRQHCSFKHQAFGVIRLSVFSTSPIECLLMKQTSIISIPAHLTAPHKQVFENNSFLYRTMYTPNSTHATNYKQKKIRTHCKPPYHRINRSAALVITGSSELAFTVAAAAAGAVAVTKVVAVTKDVERMTETEGSAEGFEGGAVGALGGGEGSEGGALGGALVGAGAGSEGAGAVVGAGAGSSGAGALGAGAGAEVGAGAEGAADFPGEPGAAGPPSKLRSSSSSTLSWEAASWKVVQATLTASVRPATGRPKQVNGLTQLRIRLYLPPEQT